MRDARWLSAFKAFPKTSPPSQTRALKTLLVDGSESTSMMSLEAFAGLDPESRLQLLLLGPSGEAEGAGDDTLPLLEHAIATRWVVVGSCFTLWPHSDLNSPQRTDPHRPLTPLGLSPPPPGPAPTALGSPLSDSPPWPPPPSDPPLHG